MEGNAITKFFSIVFYAVLPKKWHDGARKRMTEAHKALTSNVELRIFWKVFFFPIVLPVSLLFAFLKIILYWLSPTKYGYMRFIMKQFYTDIVRDKRDIKTAIKRAKLSNELFVKGGEKRVSFGELNEDKTFYVIRPYYYLEPNELIFRNIANLLTQYYYNLQKLSYAIENNYIPVVDWQNYGPMPHGEDFPVNGTTNTWEYYWNQPSEYTLEEVYKSKNVILSTRNIGQFGYIPNCAMTPPFNTYADNLAKKCPQYSQYFTLNKITVEYIENKYRQLFPENEKVLGVIVRGAAYGQRGTPMHSHPKQTKIEELIRAVKKYAQEWDYSYIFFVNEMQELVDRMQEEFGEHLIVLPRLRDHLDRPADGITENPMYAPGQRYQTNLDYITEIALLSKCNALIGSMSSGMRTAIIWNQGEYEERVVFENGLW